MARTVGHADTLPTERFRAVSTRTQPGAIVRPAARACVFRFGSSNGNAGETPGPNNAAIRMKSALLAPYAARRSPSDHRRPWWSRWLAGLLKWPSRSTVAMPVRATPKAPTPAPSPKVAPRIAAIEAAVRSVPIPIDALTQLLNAHPTARARLRHLALVESSCRLSPGDPFGRLPPRVMEIAVRQLDAVLARQPSLRVLRLQLERHLQGHRARIAATLAAEDRKWQIEGAVATTVTGLSADSMIGGPWGITDFLETLPLDRTQSDAAMPPELRQIAGSEISCR